MRQDVRERIEMIERGEVPEGYFLLEDKILPLGWMRKSLDQCGRWIGGGTPSKSNNAYWEEGTIPWASSQDIMENELTQTKYKISKFAVVESATNIVPQNAIVMVMRSGVLRHSFPVSKTISPIAINQDLKAIIPKHDIHNNFLFCILRNEEKNILKSCVKAGTTVESVEFNTLKSYEIMLPQIDEQVRIAEVISKWDRAIELKEKSLKQKKLQKKGLAERLLTGKLRLPGFSQKWSRVQLKDVFERVIRRNDTGGTNVLTISAQKGLIKQGDYFNKTVASETLDNYLLLKQGEFAYNRSYSNGYPMGAIKRLNLYPEGVVTTLYLCFKFKNDKHSSEYFEQFFENGNLNYALTKIAQEGARAHGLLNISQNEFFAIKILIPSKEEQISIASVLVHLDKEINLLKQELKNLKTQKKGLMQLLLTGKVRVTDCLS